MELFTDYLVGISKIDAPVAFWTPARQLELAKWCVEKHRHSAGYIERLFNVMISAFNDACVTKIRLDAVGNKVETALMSHAPKIVWKREAIATELKIPARRPRPATLSIEQMAAVLDSLKTPPSLPARDNESVHMGSAASHHRFRSGDQIKKLFRNVPREQRSLWMGHVVRDGSRTTAITSQTIRKCSRMSRWPPIASSR